MAWNTKKKAQLPAILQPITTPLDDYVVVLESDKPCNKKIDIEDPNNWKIDSYQKHYQFNFHKMALHDVDTLYEDLAKLSNNEYCFLVYGAPTDHVLSHPSDKHRRLTLSREGQEATLKVRSARIILLDIDTLIIPDLTFDQEGAERVRELLVQEGKLKELDDTRLIFQWTSKAGWKPNSVRLRIIGLLEAEATLESIKAWAAASGMVDVKIYDAQQPIYIANPEFVNGKPPLPSADRIGMLEGQFDEIATLPEKAEQETKSIPSEAEDEDLVLAKLYETGSIKKKISPGKFDITCPWVHEHTGGVDDGCVLMLPNYSGYSQHAFKCQHEHCKDKGFADLVAAIELDDANEDFDPIEDSADDNGSIDALIRRYAFVGDQDRLYDFVTGALHRLEAINHAYAHIHRRPQAGTALLQHPALVRVDTMIYLPGHPRVTRWKDQSVVNLWKEQVTIIPEKGDVEPWMKHVRWLVPNKADRDHMLNWLAFMVQHQDIKINHALLIGGPQRIGKDTLLDPIKKYLGHYNVNEPSAEELKEQFTDYLHHTKLVVFQECQNFDKLNVENKLKPMLAAPPDTLRVRLFGAGFYKTPNIVQCVFMSNHRNALKISKGDGRYFTIWCNVEPKSETYYKNLYDWMGDNGNEIVIDWLLSRKLTGFNPAMRPPSNEYKELITDMSGTDLEILLSERLVNKEPPFNKPLIKVADIFQQGGWEGVTMKRFTTALDSLGCVPKKVREGYGKRLTHSLWAIHDQAAWHDKPPKEWLDEYLGEYTGNKDK